MSENTEKKASEKEVESVEKVVEQKVVENTENANVEPKDFNWETYEQGISVDDSDSKDLKELYDSSIEVLNERDVITGVVIKITDREAIIDIDFKSEGVISLNEFRYNPDLKEGDRVDVIVDVREDKAGQLILSHRKARTIKSWDKINEVQKTGEIVTGLIKCRTRGGMIVDLFGIETFLPGSQIDVRPIKDYDQFVNKTMEFKVVKINHEYKNVVVSHKALIEADLQIQKREIIAKLEKGQILEGIVKNITSYGAFVDLGGVDGLVHITDLSWSRVNHPSEVLEIDQKINVVILEFDEEKTKVQLGYKQLKAHPWDNLSEDVKIGDKVKGKVVVLADYGAFLELENGVEGLVHVSEMSWATHLSSAQDFVKVGDQVEAVILTLDREERKMSLGFKQVTPDPWKDIAEKYPVGSKCTGTVRNFTNFGAFVELEVGVDGLVHITDLSWNKKVKHPSEILTSGDKIEVVVLELNVEDRKLSLGYKQLEENAWDAFEGKYAIDTVHTAQIDRVFDKGAIVLFKEEKETIEAFIPNRHLEKEDGSKLVKGDEAEFKVIEFDKNLRRVLLSHTMMFKDINKSSAKESRGSYKGGSPKHEQKIEKSTMGDLDILSQLKDKMDS